MRHFGDIVVECDVEDEAVGAGHVAVVVDAVFAGIKRCVLDMAVSV